MVGEEEFQHETHFPDRPVFACCRCRGGTERLPDLCEPAGNGGRLTADADRAAADRSFGLRAGSYRAARPQLNVRYTAPAAEEPEAAPAELPPEGEAVMAGQEASSEQETSVQEDADAVPDDLVLLDTFIATAYCVTGTTSTGTYTTVGRTLAVNPNIIPYGTHVWLYLDDGTLVGDYYAEDTGSNMMAHPYVIDIYMGEGSYNDCILWGAQHVSVYVEADAS